MIQITDIRVPLESMNLSYVTSVAADLMKIAPSEIRELRLTKKSIDARKKNDIHFVCAVECEIKNAATERRILSRRIKSISQVAPYVYSVEKGNPLPERPIVVGSGPAGLFAALITRRRRKKPPRFGGAVLRRRRA